jgi:hypothetical protein
MAWTGTDKQIAWAKAIRAEAEPVVREWISLQCMRSSRLQQRTSKFDLARSATLRECNAGTRLLHAGLKIEDARFWIDMRDCPSAADFIAATELWLQRHGGLA